MLSIMKSPTWLLAVALFVGGCQPSSQPEPPASPIAAASSAAVPTPRPTLPRFEVRDFRLDEDKEKNGSMFKGRGTLVAMDDAERRGTLVVWLSAKRGHDNDETHQLLFKPIILRDGIGTFDTFDIVASETREKKQVRYYDWQITGFVRLQEGAIVSEAIALPK